MCGFKAHFSSRNESEGRLRGSFLPAKQHSILRTTLAELHVSDRDCFLSRGILSVMGNSTPTIPRYNSDHT